MTHALTRVRQPQSTNARIADRSGRQPYVDVRSASRAARRSPRVRCAARSRTRTRPPRPRPCARPSASPAGGQRPGQRRGAPTQALRTSSPGASTARGRPHRPPRPRGRRRAAPTTYAATASRRGQQQRRRRRASATGRRCRSAAAVSPSGQAGRAEQHPRADLRRLEHVVRLDDVEHGPRVGLGRRPVRPGPGCAKPRMVRAMPISSGWWVRSPYSRASDSRSIACSGSASPRATTPRTTRAKPRPQSSEVAANSPYARRAARSASARSPSSAGGVRLDRPQRRDGPLVADPLAERQEHPGQPAGLGEPAGQQPGERGGAAQPGPADRIVLLGEQPGGPAERRVGAGEVAARGRDPGQVLQRPGLAARIVVADGDLVRLRRAGCPPRPAARPGSRPCRAGASPRPARSRTRRRSPTASASCHGCERPGKVAEQPVRPAGQQQRAAPGGSRRRPRRPSASRPGPAPRSGRPSWSSARA